MLEFGFLSLNSSALLKSGVLQGKGVRASAYASLRGVGDQVLGCCEWLGLRLLLVELGGGVGECLRG